MHSASYISLNLYKFNHTFNPHLGFERQGVPFSLEWDIIDRAPPFNPTTRKCRLCLKEKYHIILNLAIAHKGGTCMIINKNLDLKIRNCSKSADSRIISLNVELYNNYLHLINIYAPAGSNSERDDF